MKILVNQENAKALNELARNQMIDKLLTDIAKDLTICQIEGWNYRGYLYRIKDIVDEFLSIKKTKQK
jgi:hypothetical protein